MGLHNPNLNWTNEVYPIKQSMAVTVCLLGGMFYAVVMAGLYFWKGLLIGPVPYLCAFTGVTLVGSLLLFLWLRKRGTSAFESL
jgi:ABC-2 type transport system permease protein